jgi:hypothetical protein
VGDVTNRRLAARPVDQRGAGIVSSLILIIDVGNTLETGQDGIVYYEGTLASVPTAYDPETDTSFIDGIGRATLYKNGVSQGYVLVVNDDSGSFRNALFQNDPIVSSGTISLAVDGGGTVNAWTVGT